MRELRGLIFGFVGLVVMGPLAASAQEWDDDMGGSGSRSSGSDSLLYALRGDGYIGVATIDIDNGPDDESFTGGGTVGGALVLDQLFANFDVFGDAREFDDVDSSVVGFGLAAGAVDPDTGRIAGALAYNNQEIDDDDGFDVFRIGAEGEVFLEVVTLGAEMGYASVEIANNDEDAFYFDTALDFYVNDDLKLEGGIGVVDVDGGDTQAVLDAGMEFHLGEDSPIALFSRWEAGISDDVDQHTFVGGIRLYWTDGGASLKTYDRMYFRDSCGGFQLFGRVC